MEGSSQKTSKASTSQTYCTMQFEPQIHCEEVYGDVEETIEKQEDRIKEYNTDADRHLRKKGRIAGITFDWVLQTRAKMAEDEQLVSWDTGHKGKIPSAVAERAEYCS